MMVMSNKDRRLMNIELPLLFDPILVFPCGFAVMRLSATNRFPTRYITLLKGLLKPEEITPAESLDDW